ncbi:hypothetical protein B484DRAFT_267439, partial [Ochromonadaceae sp. CCMP2298]
MYLTLVALALRWWCVSKVTAQSIQAARLRGAQQGHFTPCAQGWGVMHAESPSSESKELYVTAHVQGRRGLGVIPNYVAESPPWGTSSHALRRRDLGERVVQHRSAHRHLDGALSDHIRQPWIMDMYKIMELCELLARLTASVPAPSSARPSRMLSSIWHTTPTPAFMSATATSTPINSAPTSSAPAPASASPMQHTPASPASVPASAPAPAPASAPMPPGFLSASPSAPSPNVFPYTTDLLSNTHNATQNYVSVQTIARPGD